MNALQVMDRYQVILLSRVYIGDRVTKIRHFSPLKTNKRAQLRTILLPLTFDSLRNQN